MTNTQRNTTVIGVLLALIITVGYVMTHKLQKQLDGVQKKNTELSTQIAKFDKLLSMRDKIESDYAELKLMLANQSKLIALTDNPSITYNYLLQILRWMDRNIDFDFSISSNKVAESQWNEYILSGKSDFRDVATFIKEIEYQRALITIEEVTITADPAMVSDTVSFSVVLKTHFSPDGTPLDIVQKKDVTLYRPSFVSFRPSIYDTPRDTEVDPSLARLDKSKVIGMTETRAFLRDDTGIIRVLSIGDRVAYGYLYAINPKQEKVIFKINQYGSSEDKTLYLEKPDNARR
jgi:hypothetical protein